MATRASFCASIDITSSSLIHLRSDCATPHWGSIKGMNNIDNSIMIYMKNERGVAVPLHVKTTDQVHVLLVEAATTRAIHRGSLHGKALYHNGRRLRADDVIGDVGIKSYDTVRLLTIDKSSAGTTSAQADDHNLVATDHGPIE